MAAPKKATAPEPSADPAAGDEQTTDYTRRAGGYVLTEKGWVIEE